MPFVRRRLAGLGLVVCLVSGALAGGSHASAATTDLVLQLEHLVASFPGGAGLWVSDPRAPLPLYRHDPEEPIITASLYKLGVLAEAERRVDSGELAYGDRIVIEPDDVTADGSFVGIGAVLTIDEALEAMITISDNGSAMALWHALGGANIDATLAKAGITDFHVALDESEDHWATPRAIGTFFTLLAKRELISLAASDRMLARLERQQIKDRLPALLPADVIVAHKTGNLPGVTHDAGIIFTRTGPRVVVAMTWDALDDDADSFISSVGAAVYSANLEPPANARYRVARDDLAALVGSSSRVNIPITNVGSRAWSATGPGSVGLIWELRNAEGTLITSSSRPQTLPPLEPNQTRGVGIDVVVPRQPGTYAVTIGLTDASGNALAYSGAATATFALRAHQPYLVAADVEVPRRLHRGEPSLLVLNYSALAVLTEHPLSISWRLTDPRTNWAVHQGTSPVGTLQPEASGAMFGVFVAPNVLGTYRLTFELTAANVVVSAPASTIVAIEGPRTYPDDHGGRAVPAWPPGPVLVTPARPDLPRITIPKPSLVFDLPRVTIPKPPLPFALPIRGR